MTELSKIEFETLWNIANSWQSDPTRAANQKQEEIEKYNTIFKRLEKLGLIKIEIRENQIYGAVATQKGKDILVNKEYEHWIPE